MHHGYLFLWFHGLKFNPTARQCRKPLNPWNFRNFPIAITGICPIARPSPNPKKVFLFSWVSLPLPLRCLSVSRLLRPHCLSLQQTTHTSFFLSHIISPFHSPLLCPSISHSGKQSITCLIRPNCRIRTSLFPLPSLSPTQSHLHNIHIPYLG